MRAFIDFSFSFDENGDVITYLTLPSKAYLPSTKYARELRYKKILQRVVLDYFNRVLFSYYDDLSQRLSKMLNDNVKVKKHHPLEARVTEQVITVVFKLEYVIVKKPKKQDIVV